MRTVNVPVDMLRELLANLPADDDQAADDTGDQGDPVADPPTPDAAPDVVTALADLTARVDALGTRQTRTVPVKSGTVPKAPARKPAVKAPAVPDKPTRSHGASSRWFG